VAARPIDPFGAEYAYVQVANDIERRISDSEITAKLSSERSFTEEYGVAYSTVRHAMAMLRERGITVTAYGRGTFVTPR
jgi:GntR family transcriptional regulator